MKNKKINDKDSNINFECEACADHVCNDECGCELSLAAYKNKDKKDK